MGRHHRLTPMPARPMDEADIIVIGAGVIGLACARALAEAGREIIILEKNESFGAETSSRNSEVIHAGLYYRPGGLRARLCVEGKARLYDYCKARHIPHDQCGKLVVAHDEEETAKLAALIDNAAANGVRDLEMLTGPRAVALEPALQCAAAVLSPSTGIIDSHALMISLLGDFEAAGGVLAVSSPVVCGMAETGGVLLEVGGADPVTLKARLVINCAGLYADQVARSITGLDAQKIPAIRPAKGQYFIYQGKAPFQRLIYPLHTNDSLGVHYTHDLGGQARLGPDIDWTPPLGDYSVDASRRDAFAQSVRRFWPSLDPEKLYPGYAGQRPKTVAPGVESDFLILGPDAHGTPNYIGLYGMESPGLTACLAIGGYVCAMAGR